MTPASPHPATLPAGDTLPQAVAHELDETLAEAARILERIDAQIEHSLARMRENWAETRVSARSA